MIQKLLKYRPFNKFNKIQKKAFKIKLLILDVDGVLTNGSVYMDSEGNEIKVFSVLDGIGMKMLRRTGVEIAIITGSFAQAIKHRMEFLGIKYVALGQERKINTFNDLKEQLNITNEQIAYVGDDIPDIAMLKLVGLPISVKNATPQIKQHASWITKNCGGNGAVREVCELIMKAQNTLQQQNAYYF
jgi:3-deoxy-D-manno-octulosonate 8-phosphate phosphatase (KDO 8-P phosphatase)